MRKTMIGRADIQMLIPHQGTMCLWDEVIAWDATRILLRADNHRDPVHPLRSGGRLRAVHLCEYGAQAMAVHGGLLARAAGEAAKPGLLVSLRAVRLLVADIQDLQGPILGRAERLHDGAGSWQYAFELRHEEDLLAEGRAAVMSRPD